MLEQTIQKLDASINELIRVISANPVQSAGKAEQLENSKATPSVTRSDVLAAMKSLDRDVAIAILQDFSVKKLGELEESDYPIVMEKIAEAA